ncbi:hypothetical protein [Arcobacter sp.]|uniref:hypothetical protein n=1 Tax=Arcobacter sp. TaxID=1872629 RepID=UPI003D0ABA13
MKNKNLREKLLNDKESLRRSIKENSQFSTADLLNIVADLIDYTLNDNDLDDNNSLMDINIIKKLMQLEEDKKNSRTEKDNFESEFNNYQKRYQLNQLQDLINKYKKEKESMIDSLDNLLSNVICDFENLKGEINE